MPGELKASLNEITLHSTYCGSYSKAFQAYSEALQMYSTAFRVYSKARLDEGLAVRIVCQRGLYMQVLSRPWMPSLFLLMTHRQLGQNPKQKGHPGSRYPVAGK